MPAGGPAGVRRGQLIGGGNMKAVVYERYGGPEVLEIKEREVPAVKKGMVLIKINATALNSADIRLMKADPFLARTYSGILKPKHDKQVLGSDVAGVIESACPGAIRFKPGDAVFGSIFKTGMGGLAQYAAADENDLALKPLNLSFEEAAAVPMAAKAALHAIRDYGKVKQGERVLVYGASGGVGTFCVQIAKHYGAEVTAVCSGRNEEQAKKIGADYVINYEKEDFTRQNKKYDVIIGVNGYRALSDYKGALNPGGRYVMAGGDNRQIFDALLKARWVFMGSGKKASVVGSYSDRDDLDILKKFSEEGSIKPVIDRVFDFQDTVEAVKYLETGHAKGKVVIKI